jgi:hypothetical protein
MPPRRGALGSLVRLFRALLVARASLASPPSPRGGGVRRAVVTASLEAVASEWVTACAGAAALTAWALHLGAGPALVAAVAALPPLAQALHLPALRATRRFGVRRVALAASVAARQPYLALALLPALPVGAGARRALLVALAAATAALGAFAQHAWTSWSTSLFRAPVRGRVLGLRSARSAASAASAALAVGVVLDRCAGPRRGVALAALAGVAWGAGVASTWLLARQPVPPAPPRALASTTPITAAPRVRRALGYTVAWNAAAGLTASLGALLVVEHLRLGYRALALHGAGVALGWAVMAPRWGRWVDRAGAGPALALSTAGAAALPFLWMATSAWSLWPIAADALLGGVLVSGQAVASAALPAAVAPAGRRDDVAAAYAAAGGLSFAAAALASGFLADRLPALVRVAGELLLGRKLLFAAASVARLAAALLARRVLAQEAA